MIVNAVLPDVKLRTIGVIHNLVMCAASVYMFLGFWNIVYPNFRDNDVRRVMERERERQSA